MARKTMQLGELTTRNFPRFAIAAFSILMARIGSVPNCVAGSAVATLTRAPNKKEFDGHLKPTAVNVLLSRYRFEVPPNSDSIAFDPKTKSTVLVYSWDLRDVTVGDPPRDVDVPAGGVLRIFVGKTYIYLIDFYAETAGISDRRWAAFQTYIESFRYVNTPDVVTAMDN